MQGKINTKSENWKIVKIMEKESPIDYHMDIDINTTGTNNLSITSTSPTMSNRVDNRNFIIKDNDLIESINSIDISVIKVETSMHRETMNRNNLSLDTSLSQQPPHDQRNHQFRKLTPVHHHPLMMNDSFEDECANENSLVNSNTSRSFPDVVPTFAHPRPSQSGKISLATADLVNSVNNNNNNDVQKIKATVKPFYREPSPVSNSNFIDFLQFLVLVSR